jgi:hypothetical protein
LPLLIAWNPARKDKLQVAVDQAPWIAKRKHQIAAQFLFTASRGKVPAYGAPPDAF